MVNWDLLLILIFYGLILLFYSRNKKKFQVQAKVFFLYKTKIGLKLMDRIAKWFPALLRFIGLISIMTGFAGMAFIFYFLLKGTIDLLLVPEAAPAVAPVLPGVKVMAGLPVLSFWHWIIAIFVVAVIHEFSHGVFARLYNVRIKSSGFAFLGPILAAFVEPEEKQLSKEKKRVQLAVFSAGPFSNIILGILCALVLGYVTAPIFTSMYQGDGVVVGGVVDDFPAAKAGIEVPFTLTGINGVKVRDLDSFVNVTDRLHPGDKAGLETDKGEYSIVLAKNPDNETKSFIGVTSFDVKRKLKEEVRVKYGRVLPAVFSWVHMLVFWLFVINIGVGLFNLLPLGPVDGGRMFLTGLFFFTNKPDKVKRIWGFISFFCLLLILINMAPYVWKLVVFIIKPLALLFGA